MRDRPSEMEAIETHMVGYSVTLSRETVEGSYKR